MRILVVEDAAKMAELVRRVLVSEHYTVDLAADGATALVLAGQHVYDAIVLDRMLPDIDGIEVLQSLRSRNVQTPVLMLTALGTVDHRVGGLDAVWGAEPDVYSNVVDLYVHYLRRKLGELRRGHALRTVRGVGYTLRP